MFKVIITIEGREQLVLIASLKKGAAILYAQGYRPCPNPAYMQMGNKYAHYNALCKFWVFSR